jgi:dephospho-CoA kinase
LAVVFKSNIANRKSKIGFSMAQIRKEETLAKLGLKPVIGLLGGIGSGKSTVAAELAKLGCCVVDADRIGHELLDELSVQRKIRRRWGKEVFGPNGKVDRAALGRVVFGQARELAALNAIAHPLIRRRIIQQVGQFQRRKGCQAIVIDAALLLETDWHELCTHLVFVRAPASARAGRVRRERGWGRQEWRDREKSQKALDIKTARAEYIVDNSSSVSCLREQVRSVFQRILDQVGPS